MRWLSNVRLPQSGPCIHRRDRRWRIGVDPQGQIASVTLLASGSQAAGHDWRGDWLSPAGVDLQINGGLGLAFPELEPADLPRLLELLELLWRDGVEAICPTLVTCAIEPLRQALTVLGEARAQHRSGRCQLLGAHLEGPFLAHARRGAHPEQHLCVPSSAALAERIEGFEDAIDLVTLAPELEGADAVIDALRRQGIVVSLGHSAASETEATAAFAAGVGMVTHAFNAMPGLHHRAPGPVGAAVQRGDVALGLIADGVHVAPTMAVLLQRLAPQQVVLVSDALGPYGLAAGRHSWDERLLLVEDGSCRLEDGTLAGATLPLLEGVVRLARWSGEPGRAIAAATVLPRRVLGEDRPVEEILVGLPLAETLRWSQSSEGQLGWSRSSS
ncbi:N-acetylglucosamine-6-phosphate deacetylase [Synechococcus sp. CS-1324]|uniref:N-acetylglucosamine-6-phosphate deacetylase n=1 Tax=Synechococcus sp. CS-1324 TaxID=2847980 RepID=UPI000DB8AB35|nr:N-acetylglucosamine-6-phosphate deacetylase [Synechococcus sp. CS-1324]MCT0229715.1 N-acetylglucosamine-6-phosphate deacetylase [Synechococcus sp. CS-1324]PZV04315.1 MAG: N-acetylglucosamine-6-phosphate deacetylase [Cyanobium sp.]